MTAATPFTNVVEVDKGQPIRVMPLHPNLSFALMPWKRLQKIVPDPRKAENERGLKQFGDAGERAYAELRNAIQRVILRTKKAENAGEYARYIADGMNGVHGAAWATPPFALWIPDELEHLVAPGPFGDDYIAYLPFDVSGVLVDAETQHIAHMMLMDAPDVYRLKAADVANRIVGVEIYHGLSQTDAKQIFHDRNLLGVIPNKTVALNSDSRDIATSIANRAMEQVVVPHPRDGAEVPLRALVSLNKRQLGARDVEWMTLSTLRSFVVTALFGRPGIELTSSAVDSGDLPNGVAEEEAQNQVVEIMRILFRHLAPQFNNRNDTVVSAPAVLAALGAVANGSTSWAKGSRRSTEEMIDLIKDVAWQKDARIWDGIAGKTTPSGRLSVAGGVKDNGSKTVTALEDSDSIGFRQIRRSVSAM